MVGARWRLVCRGGAVSPHSHSVYFSHRHTAIIPVIKESGIGENLGNLCRRSSDTQSLIALTAAAGEPALLIETGRASRTTPAGSAASAANYERLSELTDDARIQRSSESGT